MIKNEGVLKFVSREGIVLASLIIYILMLVFYYIPAFNDMWGRGDNFRIYAIIITVVMALLLALAGIVIQRIGFKTQQNELRSLIIFAIGAVILFFVPTGTAFGILPENIGAIQIILLILGILICLTGAVATARAGGFFLVWTFGALFYLIVASHEAFKMFIWTGSFGILDMTLSYLAVSIIGLSFLLYVYYEVKFFYLAYLVDEALVQNKAKKYEAALELLDKALTIYPYYVTALNNKGNVLFRMKKYEDAKYCYEKALEYDPDYQKAQLNMKQVSKKVGRRVAN